MSILRHHGQGRVKCQSRGAISKQPYCYKILATNQMLQDTNIHGLDATCLIDNMDIMLHD